MKKKFVLVLALVLLVASASVFAGVKFSGTFDAGYAFYFGKNSTTDKNYTGTPWYTYDGDQAEFELDGTVADENGIWSISLDTYGNASLPSGIGFGDLYLGATGTVNLAKALKQDKFNLSWTVGNKTNTDGLYSFGDGSGNHFMRQRIYGQYVSYVDFSMPDTLGLKVRLAASPIQEDGVKAIPVQAFVGLTPVDGISFSAGYTHSIKVANKYILKNANAFGGSVTFDIAKLANSEDFKASIGLSESYVLVDKDLDSNGNRNYLVAQVAGGIKAIDGVVEFAMLNKTYSLYAKINLNLVENMGWKFYYENNNINNNDDAPKAYGATSPVFAKDTWNVGTEVSYKLAGVKWILDLSYEKSGTYKEGALRVIPSIEIKF